VFEVPLATALCKTVLLRTQLTVVVPIEEEEEFGFIIKKFVTMYGHVNFKRSSLGRAVNNMETKRNVYIYIYIYIHTYNYPFT
jgi:hypothetical protein